MTGSEPEGASTTSARLRLARLDDAGLERPGRERDRPVPAGGREAGVVEEENAEVAVRARRLGDEAAVHVGVAARLVHEQGAHAVELLLRVAALLEDRRAGDRADAAGDDPERLARGVVVDGRHEHGAHRRMG